MKPPLDFTQYASFRVDDLGLPGFAGVDLSQETGAFAVSVGCGYFNDPKGLPGLAHALEHAVFLGSALQPELKGWDEFLSSRGGIHNAHTKPHITTFYVSAPSRHLPELFNVFLDHLFSPLLLPEQLEAEVGRAPNIQHPHNDVETDLRHTCTTRKRNMNAHTRRNSDTAQKTEGHDKGGSEKTSSDCET